MPSRRPPSWPAVAAELAVRFPRARLEPAVVAWADRAARRRPWTVGFSGGADSLALLLLLWAHWPERRAGLRVLHFDHCLRGREARADAVFARRVGTALGLDTVVGRWSAAHPAASEAEARAARLAFFAAHGRVLWLGHQQDDVAESLLMRLARGSGTAGLAAPRPVQKWTDGKVMLRPLLGLGKNEIVAALQAAGAVWREDATNAGGCFFRNRIRRDVVPAWQRAAGRDAVAGAARSRRLLEEDDAALEAWLDLLDTRQGQSLAVSSLAGLPRALARRALHRWLLRLRPTTALSSQAFEDLLDCVVAGKPTRRSLDATRLAELRGGILRAVKNANSRGAFPRRAN